MGRAPGALAMASIRIDCSRLRRRQLRRLGNTLMDLDPGRRQ